MTTIFEEEVTCAVCGNEQTVQELGSTNAFGPMDLDTRPPEMKRSTMRMWLHECTECGFVSGELGKAMPTDASTVATSGYRAELANAKRPRLANAFVCRSMLDAAAGDPGSAGWRRLHAAWVCDDEEATDAARTLRGEAIALFERARAQGERAMKTVVGGDELLFADLARRSGEFEQARAFCSAGLARVELTTFVRQLLELEQELCGKRDAACHTVGEVEKGAGEEERGTVH